MCCQHFELFLLSNYLMLLDDDDDDDYTYTIFNLLSKNQVFPLSKQILVSSTSVLR